MFKFLFFGFFFLQAPVLIIMPQTDYTSILLLPSTIETST